MLKLNINENKSLTFEIQLSGINSEMLTGYLRFEIDEVEYGFPVEFSSETISVEIPPLKNIINKELKEGDILNGKLEVNGNGHFLNPWSGDFQVSNPVKMEAKVYDEEGDNFIAEAPKISVSSVVAEKREKFSKKKLIEKNESKKEVVKEIKEVKPKKKKQLLQNVTEQDIYKYMVYRGTKNKRVQEIIFEQCEVKAGSDKPKDIFKEVYKFLNKKGG